MYKKQAFTFIELVVSITIIAIISFSGVFYFNDFIWRQEISIYVNNFEQNIKELNNNVKKQEIFDYTLELHKNSAWFTISKNNIWWNHLQNYIFDTQNKTWNITIQPSTSEIWEIKIYDWIKKINQLTKNWLESLELNINNNTTILSSLSWSQLNTVIFQYLNNQNINESVTILDILDNSMTSYDSLIIENISWKIKYIYNWSELSTPIIILFDKNWIEDKLELN